MDTDNSAVKLNSAYHVQFYSKFREPFSKKYNCVAAFQAFTNKIQAKIIYAYGHR